MELLKGSQEQARGTCMPRLDTEDSLVRADVQKEVTRASFRQCEGASEHSRKSEIKREIYFGGKNEKSCFTLKNTHIYELLENLPQIRNNPVNTYQGQDPCMNIYEIRDSIELPKKKTLFRLRKQAQPARVRSKTLFPTLTPSLCSWPLCYQDKPSRARHSCRSKTPLRSKGHGGQAAAGWHGIARWCWRSL